MLNHLTVENPSATTANGEHRLEAMVDGRPLWFTSADAPLRSSPEGWGTLLLLPALHRGRTLKVPGEVCPQWAARLDAVLDVYAKWWNYPKRLPALTPARTAPTRASRVGLCFSGGVDSFFSLLRFGRPIHDLVYLLFSHDRWIGPRYENDLRRLAQQRGQRAIVVRTNLREHHLYQRPRWERTHGAALAALGHFFGDSFGTLVISSSYPYAYSLPHGSHFELDPLWSSGSVEINHFGADYWRTDKLIQLGDEPVLHHHLSVCPRPAATINCCRCEKCLRTQLVLLTSGHLHKFHVFDHSLPLAVQADRVRWIDNPGLYCVYERFLQAGLPSDLAGAVRRLLARSRRLEKFKRIKAAMRKFLGLRTKDQQEAA